MNLLSIFLCVVLCVWLLDVLINWAWPTEVEPEWLDTDAFLDALIAAEVVHIIVEED